MASKKITEFDTHSITAADYLLFSNAAGTITYKTTLLALLSNLTLVSETVGFTISGGTTPKTLTLDTDITASTLATISTAILVSNLDTDGTLAANSDTKVASQKATKTYVDTTKSLLVALTGNQTVAGIKTFSSFPISPSSAPSADYEMANKKYVDDTAFAGVGAATESAPGAAELATQAETDGGTDDERIVTPKKLATTTKIPAGVSSALSGKVATSGNETINGVKTFGSIPVLPASDPTEDNQAVRLASITTKAYSVSNNLKNSNDSEKYTTNSSYTPIKKTTLNADLSVVRIKFDGRTDNAAHAAKFKIYKNGIEIGSEQTSNSIEYTTYSEDFTNLVSGDYFEIYAKSVDGSSYTALARNFRFYYDRKITKIGALTLSAAIDITDGNPISTTNNS